MRDTIIGVFVAAFILAGVYAATETLAGRSLGFQSAEPARSADELLGIIEAEETEDQDRLDAILELGKSDTDLDVIVPVLGKLSASHNPVFRQSASYALSEIGADAVPHLQQYFDSRVETNAYDQPINMARIHNDRSIGCSALKAIGDDGEVYLPQLKDMLESEDSSLKKCALYALQGMEETSAKLIDEVIACLTDSDFNNQCFACRIIEQLGPRAVHAEDQLETILETGLPSVRGWAAVCLGAIGPTDSTVENATRMAAKLEKASPVESERILLGLAEMGPRAEHVKPQIREKMKNWDRYVQAHAAYALWRIDPKETVAFEVVGGLLDSNGYEQDGLNLVIRMEEGALPLLNKVLSQADAHDPITRELTAAAIGAMGPQANSASSSLENLLKDSDSMVRFTARRSLVKLGEAAKAKSNPATGDGQ